MIVLNLQCAAGHRFDGWFASSAAFDDQLQRHLVECPSCASHQVTRLPSGPRVLTHGAHGTDVAVKDETSSAVAGGGAVVDHHAQLAAMIHAAAEALAGAEDVDTRFPEEARKMHYGETPARGIRGQATLDEMHELLEEGVPVLPLPIPPKRETH